MQKSNINPTILQQVLESAPNAGDKGQSQFFTPIPFGQLLAHGLPKCRPGIVDLTCGAGHLLQASANNTTTTTLLGADIDPCRVAPWEDDKTKVPAVTKLTKDLTLLGPLLKEIQFTADCFVLNPPWRLFWHRSRLEYLKQSKCAAVRMAMEAQEDINAGGCPKECIDSTIATLAIALDLCTVYGEGLLIGNDATLQRLLFDSGAPFAMLAKHVWCHLQIPGNPMTGLNDCSFVHEEQFHTGVIYFALDHPAGPKHLRDFQWDKVRPEQVTELRQWRMGAEVRGNYTSTVETQVGVWQAAREHLAELEGRAPRVPWNLWLNVNGRIKTALSRFEERSVKVNKREAARLFALTDRSPMELVLQRAQRDELLHVAEQAGWRVQPELLDAVRGAIQQYHSARAPLYPLPEIQRLGYLDEQDAIICKTDLLHSNSVLFKAGGSYPLRTQTVQVKRTVSKPNPQTGEEEDIELSGQELALLLEMNGREYCFMDARLMSDPKTEIPNMKKGADKRGPQDKAIDFSLQDLCAHFIIPDVPDVATVNPTGYAQNLKALEGLQAIVA